MNDDYLTLVFQQPISSDVQRVLASGEWSAASHSHAIHDRDRIDRIATDAAILNDRQAKRIAALQRERDELLTVFSIVIYELDRRESRNKIDAPGHCHDIHGVWDSDNGALAGKPCAWCAVWDKAKALRNSAREGETK